MKVPTPSTLLVFIVFSLFICIIQTQGLRHVQ